jgi:peroxiredoxin Q/BCP
MAHLKTRESKLKEGDKAPHFEAILQDGSKIASSDLLGKRTILFFYPQDGTPTCTKEACNLRDHYTKLKKAGFTLLGSSEDSMKKHQNFIRKFELPFPLISDKNLALAKAFDIYGPKKFMGKVSNAIHRTTFIIDKTGHIEKVIHPVISADHSNQILEELGLR